MARGEVPLVVFDPATGMVANGAQVAMTFRSNGAAAAAYSAASGGSTLASPLMTDNKGRVNAWMERGAYQASITVPGSPAYDEPFDIAPAGDGDVDTNWIGTNAVTSAKLAVGAATGDKINIAAGTTFPASPVDGQLFSYIADATNGIEWLFRYVSAGGTYKWRFVGGSDLVLSSAPTVSTSSTTYAAISQLALTAPLAGDYDIHHGCATYMSTANVAYAYQSFAVGATQAQDGDATLHSYSSWASQARSVRKTGVAANTLIELRHKSSSTTYIANFYDRWLRIRPARVLG